MSRNMVFSMCKLNKYLLKASHVPNTASGPKTKTVMSEVFPLEQTVLKWGR
jgi:hypothetical protein